MSHDQSYPFPQVFLVDEARSQHLSQPPQLVPCWTFPPAQQREARRVKSRACVGSSTGSALAVLMLFLLVFAALGFEAYQIQNMQRTLRDMTKEKPETVFMGPEKQIGLSELTGKDTNDRPAAHVMGRIEKENFWETLRWDPHGSRAFTSGGVSYLFAEGSLQVNETGLYHVYSRVELNFKNCSPKSSFLHSVFLRRGTRSTPVTLMEAHRAGFCSQVLRHPWTTESYLGAALQLQKSDRVFVNVSQPSFLTHANYANFFGLYKL